MITGTAPLARRADGGGDSEQPMVRCTRTPYGTALLVGLLGKSGGRVVVGDVAQIVGDGAGDAYALVVGEGAAEQRRFR